MRSSVARLLGAIGAAILCVMLGSGVASADALAGQTYDDAAATVSQWGGKAVVGTVSGDQLEIGSCIVVSSHKSIFLDSSGKNNRANDYVLSLNCNNHVAAPGQPGNSAMSPDGLQAKEDQQMADYINKNRDYCERNDGTMDWCKLICNRSGRCEI